MVYGCSSGVQMFFRCTDVFRVYRCFADVRRFTLNLLMLQGETCTSTRVVCKKKFSHRGSKNRRKIGRNHSLSFEPKLSLKIIDRKFIEMSQWVTSFG